MLEKEKNNNIDFSIICPSIFASNFLNIEKNLLYAKNKGVKYIHLDIMDGHFVPNISFGPKVSEDIISFGHFEFDVHLMLENPEIFIPKFVFNKVSFITIHFEINKDIKNLLLKIKSFNIKAGISIKPKTEFEDFINFIEKNNLSNMLDLLLIMSVEPGFSGQKFINDVLPKIKKAKDYKIKNNLNYLIQVDGGINFENYNLLIQNGADLLVMGNNFFKN